MVGISNVNSDRSELWKVTGYKRAYQVSCQNSRVVFVDAKRGKLMGGWTYKFISADSEGIEVNADELNGWLTKLVFNI